ncbi:hypothetical protein OXIME_000631 [Oxyplasma meridianum]|uniref:Glycosyltransferase 2-like domain-containing protein n=1 Tax=Oxyplasma meridianum TaxID=3073602 RepID=A0AAX4NFZ5_9ARCH
MDILESLIKKNFQVVNTLGNGMIISFCSWIPDLGDIHEDSIRSIDNMGKEVGFSYEIIVTGELNGVTEGEGKLHLMRMFPELNEVILDHSNAGYGKKAAVENSAGKFLIMFDARTVYNLDLADMIHNFILSGIKKMVFSPLAIIPRMIISEVGSWRELTDGEDIDLYTRIALSYGILAFPFIGSEDGRGGFYLPSPDCVNMGVDKLGERLIHLRDLIIGCNHSWGDLKPLLNSRNGKFSVKIFLLYTAAYVLSKISSVKPYKFDRNNYLIVLESILESLVLKEYTRIETTDMPIRFRITDKQASYLMEKSKLYRDIKDSIIEYRSVSTMGKP